MKARSFEVSITWATKAGRARRGGAADLLRGNAQFTVCERSVAEDEETIAAYVLVLLGLDREECSVLAVKEVPEQPGVRTYVTITKQCPRCLWTASGTSDVAPFRKGDACPACYLPAEED